MNHRLKRAMQNILLSKVPKVAEFFSFSIFNVFNISYFVNIIPKKKNIGWLFLLVIFLITIEYSISVQERIQHNRTPYNRIIDVQIMGNYLLRGFCHEKIFFDMLSNSKCYERKLILLFQLYLRIKRYRHSIHSFPQQPQFCE